MTPQTMTRPEQDQSIEKKIELLRAAYRDAPEMAKVAVDEFLDKIGN